MAPERDRVPSLMAERWSVRPFGFTRKVIETEIDNVLKLTQDPMRKIEEAFTRTYVRLYDRRLAGPLDLSEIDVYPKLAPTIPEARPCCNWPANARRTKISKTLGHQTPDSGHLPAYEVTFSGRVVTWTEDLPVSRGIARSA